jgi:hypothetical protein
MALRAVPDHPKFAQLKARLGLPKGATLGYLECLWHFTGRFCPQGNLGKYEDSAIEAWAEWPGEPGAMIAAMIESRWIDHDDVHRLLIHDWHQHADKATKNALKRAKLDFCTPTVRTEVSRVRTASPGVRIPYCEMDQASRLPEPVPEPAPGPEPVPVPGTSTLPSAAEIAAACELAAETFDLSDEQRKEGSKGNGTSKKSLLNSEVEAVLDQVAGRIHTRHPAIRRCSLAEVKNRLLAIIRRTQSSKRLEVLHQIEQNHLGWCAIPDWNKENGQFAKGLDNWLAPTKERWTECPPSQSNRPEDNGNGPEPYTSEGY